MTVVYISELGISDLLTHRTQFVECGGVNVQYLGQAEPIYPGACRAVASLIVCIHDVGTRPAIHRHNRHFPIAKHTGAGLRCVPLIATDTCMNKTALFYLFQG
ncbi:hypothetical protein O206_22880 [Ochrobactrum sp. EGD-AQ16]|nr:hypothetical protein O206_22880 [Ochrobactrum sp. EGD-AQ16]